MRRLFEVVEHLTVRLWKICALVFYSALSTNSVWADPFAEKCSSVWAQEYSDDLERIITSIDFGDDQYGLQILSELDSALEQKTALINEPIVRILYSLGYLLESEFFAAYANSELA